MLNLPSNVLWLFKDAFTDSVILNNNCKMFIKEWLILFSKNNGFSDGHTKEFKSSPWFRSDHTSGNEAAVCWCEKQKQHDFAQENAWFFPLCSFYIQVTFMQNFIVCKTSFGLVSMILN